MWTNKNKDVLKVGELKELERLWWINEYCNKCRICCSLSNTRDQLCRTSWAQAHRWRLKMKSPDISVTCYTIPAAANIMSHFPLLPFWSHNTDALFFSPLFSEPRPRQTTITGFFWFVLAYWHNTLPVPLPTMFSSLGLPLSLAPHTTQLLWDLFIYFSYTEWLKNSVKRKEGINQLRAYLSTVQTATINVSVLLSVSVYMWPPAPIGTVRPLCPVAARE